MPAHVTRILMITFLTIILGACASKPYSPGAIARHQLDSQAQRVPLQTWTSTTPMLECVGDQMRENRIVPIIVGWGVNDTSGKTGVEQGMIVRSALHKIARRGAGIRVTSMGVAPMAPDQRLSPHSSAEQQLRATKAGNDRFELATPDWIIEGGVSSTLGATKYQQKSSGIAARDFDVGTSASRSFDTVYVSYTLKRFGDGIDITGATVDLTVVYQQGSANTDIGGYVAYRSNGNKHGAGVRIGSSNGFNESPEESLRVAVETAVAMLFAEQNAVDLSTCPAQSPPLNPKDIKQQAPLTHNQVATFFDSLTQVERTRWLQQSLTARNYDIGPSDGQLGNKTRSAIAAFERDARLPPSGGRVELPLLAAIANERIARGEDIRDVPLLAPKQSLRIALNVPYGTYYAGQKLKAQVVVPQAGHLTCVLNSPDDGIVTIYPLLESRSTFVAARTPVHLRAATDGAGQPSVTLVAGKHELFCLQSRTALAAQARAGSRKNTWAETIEVLRRVAGPQLISDSVVAFEVRPVR